MFQITLRAARISCGLTQNEVALYCELPVCVLDELEKDSSLLTVRIIKKIIKLYKVPLCLIFIGLESDYAKYKSQK